VRLHSALLCVYWVHVQCHCTACFLRSRYTLPALLPGGGALSPRAVWGGLCPTRVLLPCRVYVDGEARGPGCVHGGGRVQGQHPAAGSAVVGRPMASVAWV
jgi:hypothetical protein